ncbi:peptidase C14 caspase catalytic subunit p20 [Myxococcus hansupus]|uniref:Peptidase C14 caspase catalytic subunit p20 n=1 Tax=Pseudomyxococcus hansupus TaxID=1297742 RepID=A0A0H4XMQ7_9BACT|nr:peptidase C14 caspase catalytic subunit p20 [Myxococcus hansupus]
MLAAPPLVATTASGPAEPAAAAIDGPDASRVLAAPPLVPVAETPTVPGAADARRTGRETAAEAARPKDADAASEAKPVVVSVARGEVRAAQDADAPTAPTETKSEVDEVHIPFSLTLVPGLSTSGFHTGNVVNNVSIGLVSTHARRVDGVAMAIAGNWVGAGGMRGAQLSVGANVSNADLLGLQSTVGVNVVRGNAEGAQLAVGGNIASGAVNGTQMGVGVNVAGQGLMGAQLGVGANVSGGFVRGLQMAVGVNVAGGPMSGLQASAGVNVAGELSGLQMSSGVSYARQLSGGQLSIINLGGEVDGAQVGIVNIANKVSGAQVGILNVARHSDGEAVGLLSFVGGGQANVAVWGSDVALANVGVKLGGRHIYSLFTVGYSPAIDDDRRRYVMGAGLGGHIPAGRFFVDIDLVGSTLHTKNLFEDTHHVLGQVRLMAGWQVARNFAVFGGVSANTLVSWDGRDEWRELGFGPEWRQVSDGGRTVVRTWPGLLAGVQI